MFGLLPLLLPEQAHLISDYLVGCGLGLTVCMFSLFALRLFNLPVGAWSHRFFLVIFTLGCLTVISVPLNLYGTVASITFIALLATITLLTGLSIRAVRQQEPGGFLYLAAFGISNIGYTVQFLRILGLIPVYWWNMHGVQISSLINMVLMTLALTERVYVAEQRALAAAQNAETTALGLAEGMTLELRQQKRKLEETLERQIRFVDMVSHEYRTPLAIIKANLDTLRDL